MRRGILATRDELRSLKGRIGKSPFDRIHEFLRSRCNLILQSSPLTEAQWRLMAQQGSYAAGLLAARTAQGRIMDLAIAYHVDQNNAYRDRAIEELKNLISWSTWVDPCHVGAEADLCTAEAAVAAVVGLDWLWEDLSEADRLRVLHAIKHKAIEPYHRAVAAGAWWYNVYHSWNAVVNSGCGLAALALGDEMPIAQESYRQAVAGLKRFFAALGREGGWDEGTGYWGYAMRYVLLLGEASDRLAGDQSIFHTRGMDATGLFPVYFSPNGQPASFGDMPSVPLLGAIYLLVKHYGQKEVTWWLDTYAFHRDVGVADWSAAGLAMLLRPVDGEISAPPDLKPLKVFNEIGWAAMADTWPRPKMYVAAKAGDLSAHHSQQDMNSIQLQVDGEMLLTDLGHGPYSVEYFSEARGSFYEVQAQAHNTIALTPGDVALDAQGNIVEAQVGKNYRWMACDAGEALGETVKFIRHVVMVVDSGTQEGKMVVVLDELTNPGQAQVDLYWHSQGKIEIAGKNHSGVIKGSQASVNFGLAASAPLALHTKERTAGQNKFDRVLQATAAGAPKLLIASVFSPDPLPGKVEIKKVAAGEIRVKAGGVEVRFKGHRKYLHLEKVVD